MLRVLPLAIVGAWWLGSWVPAGYLLSLTLALGVGLTAGTDLGATTAGPWGWTTALHELVVGLAFVLAVLLTFTALRWALRYVERPLPELHSGPLSLVYVLCAGLLVLRLGGHRAFVQALGHSYARVPPEAGFARDRWLSGVLALLASSFELSISLALPLLVALGLLDGCVALSQRALSVRHADVERSAWRSAVLVFLACLMLSPLVSRVPAAFRGALEAASRFSLGVSP